MSLLTIFFSIFIMNFRIFACLESNEFEMIDGNETNCFSHEPLSNTSTFVVYNVIDGNETNCFSHKSLSNTSTFAVYND